MKKAGAILALISGVIGLLHSIYYIYIIFSGGLNEVEGGGLLVTYAISEGLIGFLIIVFAGMTLESATNKTAISISIVAILGILLGVFLLADIIVLAIFVISLVGGILVLMSKQNLQGAN